ncbi:unannotated protein [freshwater metagenome]|uniref:Unannotated protein n=1 Tax=freshwater metagenome TaxID=449393 RepID=A0A6J6FUB4_9ZZZZ
MEAHVISDNEPTGRLTPSVATNGLSGSSGFGNVHGRVPSITSSPCAPAATAAARMKILMLDPVCRGANAMFTSLRPATKGCPPTMARTAPVLLSSDTMAVSMPAVLLGNCSRRAFSAADWATGSRVVWMRKPPRNNLLYRS